MAELLSIQSPDRDLLDFEGEALYFEAPVAPEVAALLAAAQEAANTAQAGAALDEASRLAPDDLTVIVALYRFHYFRHDYAATLPFAAKAMAASGRRLNIPADWRALTVEDIDRAAAISMPMLRFYLWALKGEGYLLMRLGRFAEAVEALEKLRLVDRADRLGGEALLALARDRLMDEEGIEG